MYAAAGGPKREMGGHRFQMGGPGTTAPPLATTLTVDKFHHTSISAPK